MNTEQIFKPLEMTEQFDAVIVGGGLAGVMCAISLAREGANVLILEKYGCLGGMATAGLVYPFMRDCEMPSKRPACAGLYHTLLERIYELGGSGELPKRHYKEEVMKVVLNRMVQEAGVKVLFHAKMFEVERVGTQIKSVRVATVSGNLTVSARYFVDASGNGDLFAFAGLPFELGRKEDGLTQPMTLNFRFGNVDWSRFDRAAANKLYKEWQAAGKIRNPREDLLIFRYPVENIMHMNTTRVTGLNPTNVFDVTKAEFELREQVWECYRFMKENIPGMENCELLSSGWEAGVRESRRVIGLYQMQAEDLIHTAKFEDSIARGTYEIDIHSPKDGTTFHAPIPPDDYYTIPYRSLLPKNMDNLLVVGRSISASHEACAGVRIMPITSCMGEAGGIAIAQALKKGTSLADVNVKEVQEKLSTYGGLY